MTDNTNSDERSQFVPDNVSGRQPTFGHLDDTVIDDVAETVESDGFPYTDANIDSEQ